MVHTGANPATKFARGRSENQVQPVGTTRALDRESSRRTPFVTCCALPWREHPIDAQPPGIVPFDQASAPALTTARAGQIREGGGCPESDDAIGTVTPVELAAGKEDAFRVHGRQYPSRRTRGRRMFRKPAKMRET